jgi:hypothetical protein
MRDEERLLRARHAMHAIEAKRAHAGSSAGDVGQGSESLIDRLRRLGLAARRAPAGSGA